MDFCGQGLHRLQQAEANLVVDQPAVFEASVSVRHRNFQLEHARTKHAVAEPLRVVAVTVTVDVAGAESRTVIVTVERLSPSATDVL